MLAREIDRSRFLQSSVREEYMIETRKQDLEDFLERGGGKVGQYPAEQFSQLRALLHQAWRHALWHERPEAAHAQYLLVGSGS